MNRQTTRLVLAGAFALLSTAFPSCKKGCYKCDCSSNQYEATLCSDDYNSQKQFNAALDYQEAQNCICEKQ